MPLFCRLLAGAAAPGSAAFVALTGYGAATDREPVLAAFSVVWLPAAVLLARRAARPTPAGLGAWTALAVPAGVSVAFALVIVALKQGLSTDPLTLGVYGWFGGALALAVAGLALNRPARPDTDDEANE